jgi:sugar-specific transcriptional regulator TrmB
MVASKETLDALREIGLNLYQRKLYAALLSRGVSSAGELSEMTGVPRSRAYDVLESLADLGFVIIKPSKPLEFVAVPPEEALENVKKNFESKIRDRIARIDRFTKSPALQELKKLYDEGISIVDPSDISGALKGRYSFYQHFANMVKNSKKEIKIMTTEKGLNELYEHHADILRKAKERGVNLRIIAPITEKNYNAYKALRDFCEIRDYKERPFGRFSVIDDSKSIVVLTHDEVHPTQDTAFWTSSEHASTNILTPTFEILWERARTVE